MHVQDVPLLSSFLLTSMEEVKGGQTEMGGERKQGGQHSEVEPLPPLSLLMRTTAMVSAGW